MNIKFDQRGQSTFEFALIMAGLFTLVVGFGALWQALDAGLFIEHALVSASHHIQMVSVGVVGDVFLF